MGQKEHMNLYYFIILPLFEQIGHADTLKNTLQFLNWITVVRTVMYRSMDSNFVYTAGGSF